MSNDWEKRFWSKVNKGDISGCWPWLGEIVKDGYGRYTEKAKHFRSHRVAYELLVGPIPEGLVIDHLCRNRCCCNPTHMEPVSNKENILRGFSPAAQHARKTHCKNGHELTDDNMYYNRRGYRNCKTCGMNRDRRYREERRSNEHQ